MRPAKIVDRLLELIEPFDTPFYWTDTQIRVLREYGFRYWVAWKFVATAHRIKDTTTFAVVEFVLPDGSCSGVVVEGNAWGYGVVSGYRILVKGNEDAVPDHIDTSHWPVLTENVTDFDVALDIAFNETGTSSGAQTNTERADAGPEIW